MTVLVTTLLWISSFCTSVAFTSPSHCATAQHAHCQGCLKSGHLQDHMENYTHYHVN